MEHVVFFPAHDGSPAFRRLASLEEAVRFVEHLRNNEGVDTFSVHSLTEVPLAFKQYFRVELPSLSETPAAPVAPAQVAEEPAEVEAEQAAVPVLVPEQPEAAEDEAEAAPAQPSLGFFAR
jgi:hypothetical protein